MGEIDGVCNEAEEAAAPGINKVRARKGETIMSIAAARSLDANDVARLNGIPVNSELKAGQEIKTHRQRRVPLGVANYDFSIYPQITQIVYDICVICG